MIIAQETDMAVRDAERALEAVLGGIVESLLRYEKVELRGFGSFRVRQRGPRKGRNPKTGESVDVPAKRIPYFKPGKEMRETLLQLEDE